VVTRSSIIQQVLVESRREGVFPLGAAVPSVDYLPVRALHQQLAKVTRFHSPRAFSYMFSPVSSRCAGKWRFACAMPGGGRSVGSGDHPRLCRCAADVAAGADRPGDLIAAESPTYYGLLQLADLLGLKVIEIPSDPPPA
jgi:DNA-binding transcriptional MocR family regulator